jgi:hypothetical protein
VLPRPSQKGQEFTIHFHYRGNVIENAGNGVLFVGARESWYPHLGDQADFASYELTMHWPRHLKLVATGAKLDEQIAGDFRVAHWRTDKPLSIAGFNLGEYATNSIVTEARTIDVYANRQLEQALSNRLDSASSDALPAIDVPFSMSSGRSREAMRPSPPSPADALKQLGKEIDSSIRFYETFSGPFPFHTLSVSQIPGTFGQGWPGLLYISTFSFLSAEAQNNGGATSLAGPTTGISGSTRPSPIISHCFSRTAESLRNTSFVSGSSVTANSWRKKCPARIRPSEKLERCLSATDSIPQERPSVSKK